MEQEEAGRINPEQAMAILKEGGIIVTRQEAIEILNHLYLLAEAVLDIYVWKEKDEK